MAVVSGARPAGTGASVPRTSREDSTRRADTGSGGSEDVRMSLGRAAAVWQRSSPHGWPLAWQSAVEQAQATAQRRRRTGRVGAEADGMLYRLGDGHGGGSWGCSGCGRRFNGTESWGRPWAAGGQALRLPAECLASNARTAHVELRRVSPPRHEITW